MMAPKTIKKMYAEAIKKYYGCSEIKTCPLAREHCKIVTFEAESTKGTGCRLKCSLCRTSFAKIKVQGILDHIKSRAHQKKFTECSFTKKIEPSFHSKSSFRSEMEFAKAMIKTATPFNRSKELYCENDEEFEIVGDLPTERHDSDASHGENAKESDEKEKSDLLSDDGISKEKDDSKAIISSKSDAERHVFT
ncbi:hypothetical protein ADUPG1_010162, partial [Aduncisulcus paluster]